MYIASKFFSEIIISFKNISVFFLFFKKNSPILISSNSKNMIFGSANGMAFDGFEMLTNKHYSTKITRFYEVIYLIDYLVDWKFEILA